MFHTHTRPVAGSFSWSRKYLNRKGRGSAHGRRIQLQSVGDSQKQWLAWTFMEWVFRGSCHLFKTSIHLEPKLILSRLITYCLKKAQWKDTSKIWEWKCLSRKIPGFSSLPWFVHNWLCILRGLHGQSNAEAAVADERFKGYSSLSISVIDTDGLFDSQ